MNSLNEELVKQLFKKLEILINSIRENNSGNNEYLENVLNNWKELYENNSLSISRFDNFNSGMGRMSDLWELTKEEYLLWDEIKDILVQIIKNEQ